MRNILKHISLFGLFILLPFLLDAQYSRVKSGKSLIKTTPTDFIFLTASLRGELPVTKNLSFQLGFSGFRSQLAFWGGTLDAKVEGYFLVPEVRCYLNKNAPFGFYISLWGRYGELKANATTDVIQFDVANYKILGIGGMLGYQFTVRIMGVNIMVMDLYLGMGYNNLNTEARYHESGRLVPDNADLLWPRGGISIGFQI